MEKKDKTLNVPNLRFPEFSGEWERKSLSDLVIRVTRKNKNNESRLPLTISAQYGLVDQISFFNKVVASNDMSNYYLLHNGEFAYNKSYSGDYPWGAIKRLDRYEKGALSSLYICFAPQQVVHSDFLVHYFESPKWHKEVSNIAGEGARNHGLLNIAVPDFFNTRHWVPSNRTEQEKIAALFNLIEERIQTQKKIIEDLKKLKDAISFILFTSETCDKWELSNLATIVMGQSPSSQCYNTDNDGLPLIQGNLDITKGKLTPRLYSSEMTKKCHTGDVILTVRAPVGEVAIADFDACIGRGVCAIRPFNNNYSVLIYQFLQHYKPKWISLEQGSTFTSVSRNDIMSIKIGVPSIQAIEILNILDDKISIEDVILNNLNSQKNYLLAQMFK